ncbi:carbohydrate ABC transporter permease [Cohnella soli]|uniref:Carbohydrate ABC transporter permease n=1 Tax=Cohnella soli TaxID=425005 RepID=A0ABW0HTI4_9BACL
MHYRTRSHTVFQTLNYAFLALLSLSCIFPFIHILAVSFSSKEASTAGLVGLLPVHFTLKSYQFILNKPEFGHAFLVSLKRVAIGLSLNMLLTLLTAYPLSKEVKSFRFRTWYAWFCVFTILFSGGLIPWYVTIRNYGLMDTIWALVLPGAVPVFNVILLLNFFRGLPKELEESSFIDGAGHWTTLWKIYAPLSLPALATITLFTVVDHWNSWFDGLILMRHAEHFPLATYLQTIIVNVDLTKLSSVSTSTVELLANVSDRTAKAAQICVAILPVLLVYPFLQKYFVTGIVLGSVKE